MNRFLNGIFILPLLIFSCSNEETTDTCNEIISYFTACGGENIYGTWECRANCGVMGKNFIDQKEIDYLSDCTNIYASNNHKVTYYFYSDELTETSSSSNYTVNFIFPKSCLDAITCDQLESDLNKSGSTVYNCTGSGDCNCTARLTNDFDFTYRYSIEGASIYEFGFEKEIYTYCINGDELILKMNGNTVTYRKCQRI